MNIFPADRAYCEVVTEIQARCFPQEQWGLAAVHDLLGQPGCFAFLGETGGEPGAFALFRLAGPESEILSLGVVPECRRRGLGIAILAAGIAQAAAGGAVEMFLEVAEDNRAARSLYACGGFEQVGRRRDYYRRRLGTADALVLRRAIG